MKPVASIVLIGLACLPAQAQGQAQPSSQSAYIQAQQAEVRAGAGHHPNMYPTNYLPYGTRIEVVAEKEGWVGIKPPPGSWSWIDFSKVNFQSGSLNHYAITGPAGTKSVATLVGPMDRNATPTVEGVSLGRGAQVTAMSNTGPVKFQDKQLLMIIPPEGEVRWVVRDAVGGLAPAPSAPSAPPTTMGPLASGIGGAQPQPQGFNPTTSQPYGSYPPPVGQGALPTVVPPPAATPTQLTNPQDRWNQAAAAMQAGQSVTALRIYTDMSVDYATSDPRWAAAAAAEAQRLRHTNAVQNFTPSATMTPTAPMQKYPDSFYTMPCQPLPAYMNTPGVPLVPYATTPIPYPQQQQPIQAAPPAGVPATNPAAVPGATGRTVGAGLPRARGYLRKSGRFVDRRPLYMLETIEGRPIYYMLPVQGVSLEAYMNHLVDVSGGTFYNPENRAEIMYVQQISMAPQQ